MVAAILALVALSRHRDIPQGFAGIWASPSGQVLAFLASPRPSQMRFNDFEYVVNDIGRVADGSYVGSWARVKTLAVYYRNSGTSAYYPAELNEAIGPSVSHSDLWHGDLYDKNAVLEVGDFRFVFGPTFSDGSIHSIKGTFTTEANHVKEADDFFYKFGFDRVSFAGNYGAQYYTVHFDAPADGKHYHGTLTYNGITYQVSGVRSGIRLGFEIDDSHFNRIDGYGYAEWTPSSKRIDAIANSEAKSTDKIYGYFAIPKVLPSGSNMELKEIR